MARVLVNEVLFSFQKPYLSAEMPFPERLVQPVSVSRGTLQVPVPDELEGVTNGSLANIIRQLSSLSKHAEEMFGKS